MRRWRVKLVLYQPEREPWTEVRTIDAATKHGARRLAFEDARMANLWVKRIVYVEPASRRRLK